MLLLDTFADIGIYRVFLIIKYALNIVFIIVPIIVIIMASKDLFMLVIKPDSPSKTIHDIVSRLVSGIIIFMLPSIISYAFTLVESYDKDTLLKYYNGASVEKIKSLEEQYKTEVEEEKSLRNAEMKEAIIKKNQEEEKRRELIEEVRKEEEETNTTPYTGDSTSSGSFGGVTVSNGVFTIPNARATSDADAPKQSGEYGLNPIFWERLSKFLNDANAKGYNITVTSGWRSYSSQLNLWNNDGHSCSERTKWVACPGGSRHNFGIAADLSFNGTGCGGSWDCNASAKWAHENAGNYGLTFRLSWEAWHIEPAQVNGGAFGACNVPC